MAQERSQPATPKRLDEARKRGQVAKSTEVNTAIVLLFSFLALRAFGGRIFETLGANMEYYLTSIPTDEVTRATVFQIFGPAARATLFAGVPVILIALTAGLFANLLQSGILLTGHPLKPDLSRINPLAGAKRLVSPKALVDLVRSLLKLTLLMLMFWFVVNDNVDRMVTLAFTDPRSSWLLIPNLAFEVAMKAVAILMVIAILDYAWQRYQHRRGLKMSFTEVRQERKDTEGDPFLRGRFRERGRALANQRMMAEVPEADVVITNPTEIAVALKYDPAESGAPTVVAMGELLIADRIRRIAEENNVPIVQNPPLAQTLNRTAEIGDEIPASLYQAVAEVLAFVYRMRGARVGS